MKLLARITTAAVLVLFAAGPALAQAQAPITKAPPPARTPSAITGPPTGMPRVGPPASDRRTTILPTPQQQMTIDPRTGQPVPLTPGQPTTPPVLDGSGQPLRN
jgi:hypothetical protein